MKKLAILLFAALTFAACDDNDSSSSSGAQSDYEVCMKTCMQYQGDYSYCRTDCADESTVVPGTTPGTSPGGSGSLVGSDNASLQALKYAGTLSQSELASVQNICEKDDEEEGCLSFVQAEFSMSKALGCYDLTYEYYVTDHHSEYDEERVWNCYFKGIEKYESAIESTSIFKALSADFKRESSCCKSWDPRYSDECDHSYDDESYYEMYVTSLIYLFGAYSECVSKMESYLLCSSKLSCDQSAESEDEAAYAICRYEESRYYQGDRYDSFYDCDDHITHYCQSQSDEADRCVRNHYKDH